jgi:hypothetical protein
VNTAFAPFPASCARRRVDEQPEHRVLGVLLDESLEQARGVAVATGAGVVLRVGKHHRLAGLAALLRAAHCFSRRMKFESEILLGVRDDAPQLLHGGLRAFFVRPIAEYGHPALVEVRHRKAGREGEDAAVPVFEVCQLGIDALAGLDEGALGR